MAGGGGGGLIRRLKASNFEWDRPLKPAVVHKPTGLSVRPEGSVPLKGTVFGGKSKDVAVEAQTAPAIAIDSPPTAYDPNLGKYGVPAGAGGNVRKGMREEVGKAALERTARYKRLDREYTHNNTSLKRKEEIRDLVADDITRAAIEGDPTKPGSDTTVLADVAAAMSELASSGSPLLTDAYRTAADADMGGSVERLRPFTESSLGEPPSGAAEQRAVADAAAEQEKLFFSQEDVPRSARTSSVLRRVDPDTGEVVRKSDKNFKKTDASDYLLDSDQRAQIKAIRDKGLEPTLPPFVGKRKPASKPAFDQHTSTAEELAADFSAEEFLSGVEGGKKPKTADIKPGDNILTIGTKSGRGFSPQAGDKWSGSNVSVDRMVEQRNKPYKELLVQELYRLTGMPDSAVSPRHAGKYFEVEDGKLVNAHVQKGFALSNAELSKWLDTWIPEWRGRFAVQNKDGSWSYPKKAPSAKWMSHFLHSLLEVNDVNFPARIESFLQDAIDAAPAAPDPNIRAKSGSRNAAWWASVPQAMGPKMQKAAARGMSPQNPDYPFPTYDSRMLPKKLDAPDLEDPRGAAREMAAMAEPEDATAQSMLRAMEGGGEADFSELDAIANETLGENTPDGDTPEGYDTSGEGLKDLIFGEGEGTAKSEDVITDEDNDALDRILDQFTQNSGFGAAPAINRQRPVSPLKTLLS